MGRAGDDGSATLARRLAAAVDLHAACRTVVEDLAARGMPLPSVYLERGGRLRCQAQHGYWQVQDGFPPHVGVLGTTYSRGVPTWVRPEESPDYIAAAPDVADEVCVPVRCEGRVIGAVNVESPRPLPADALLTLARAADLLGRRLAELGGPSPESEEQKLVRHTIVLAELTEPGDIQQRALTAARELSALDSAAIMLLDERDRPTVRARVGPLADACADWPPMTSRTSPRGSSRAHPATPSGTRRAWASPATSSSAPPGPTPSWWCR